MGGVNSYCIGRCTKTEECPENHSRLPKRFGGHKRNLSSTFSQINPWDSQVPKMPVSVLSDVAATETLLEPRLSSQSSESCGVESFVTADLLNINTAGEEELMTLPGINRTTARNIVQYRKEIGGRFRRIEDLVLVTGIGGDKFEVIKAEIGVGGVRGENGVSGMPQTTSVRASGPVCVNTANMFQLMQLGGVNQVLAERIVSHREKRGEFQSVEDLLRVKGVDSTLLSAIRHKLVLQQPSPSSSVSYQPRKSSPPSSPGDSAVVFTADTPAVQGHRRSASQQMRSPDTVSQLSRLSEMFSPSQLDLITQLRPLSQRVTRPRPQDPLDSPLTFRRDGREVIRIASWNLERLGADKMGNPGVREVVCLTLLENAISLLAIQEVADPDAVKQLCAELNCPSLPNTRRWSGHQGQWTYRVSESTGRMFQGSEYQALVWDTSRGVKLERLGLLENGQWCSDRAFTRSPVVAHFTMQNREWEILVVGVHLKAARMTTGPGQDTRTRAEVDTLPLIARAIDETASGSRDIDVAILGDFNLSPDAENFGSLRERGFTNLIGAEQTTNVGGTRCLDNVWFRGGVNPEGSVRTFTGHCGVVRRGLEHPFIPGGRARGNWGWNGVPSDHCPVWAEFFTDPVHD